jgi:hypothetical protein
MKKITFLLTVTAVLGLLVSTSNAEFAKGQNYLGPRIGIGVNGSSIALGAGYEYGVTNEIGVGALIDYYQWSYDAFAGYGGKYTYIIFGAQGNYHFGKLLKWDSKIDPFAGLVLAYQNITWKWNDQAYNSGLWSASASGITLGGQAGIRYFLSPMVALYGQVGFGITYLKAGVDFKF